MGCTQSAPEKYLSPIGTVSFLGDPLNEKNVRQQLTSFVVATPRPLGWTVLGKVVSVHDGDTYNVAIAFGSEVVVMAVRLLGCDTPELSKKEERQAGLKVKEYVESLFQQDAFVRLETPKTKDKYGRLLAKVIRLSDGLNIADHLIQKNYAYQYNGEKKKVFAEWWTNPS